MYQNLFALTLYATTYALIVYHQPSASQLLQYMHQCRCVHQLSLESYLNLP